MSTITLNVRLVDLAEFTKALDELNHNRSYIDGLEAWILRSEAENERLREQNEQLKQPARGVDGSTEVVIREQMQPTATDTRGGPTLAELSAELNRVDAALGLPHTATPPRLPDEPLHPRLWEIAELKHRAHTAFGPEWEDLVTWARKNLDVPNGDSVAPHILRVLQDQAQLLSGLRASLNEKAIQLTEARAQLYHWADQVRARDEALRFALNWVKGAVRGVGHGAVMRKIEDALKC